jgi:hypothetical protein
MNDNNNNNNNDECDDSMVLLALSTAVFGAGSDVTAVTGSEGLDHFWLYDMEALDPTTAEWVDHSREVTHTPLPYGPY